MLHDNEVFMGLMDLIPRNDRNGKGMDGCEPRKARRNIWNNRKKIYNLKGSPESRRHEGAIWPIEQLGEGIEMGQQTGLRRDRRPA